MLVSLATLLMTFAGLLLCIAAPLSGHFGEVLREYAAKAVIVAIFLAVVSAFIAQSSSLVRVLGFITLSFIAFVVVELRLRFQHHQGSTRAPTFTNFRRSGKVRVSQDEPHDETSSILEHDEADPWR